MVEDTLWKKKKILINCIFHNIFRNLCFCHYLDLYLSLKMPFTITGTCIAACVAIIKVYDYIA